MLEAVVADMGYLRTPVIVGWIAVVMAFAVPVLSGCANSRGAGGHPAHDEFAVHRRRRVPMAHRRSPARRGERHGAANRRWIFRLHPGGRPGSRRYGERLRRTLHIDSERVPRHDHEGQPCRLCRSRSGHARAHRGHAGAHASRCRRHRGADRHPARSVAGDYRITAVRTGPAGMLPTPIPSPTDTRS